MGSSITRTNQRSVEEMEAELERIKSQRQESNIHAARLHLRELELVRDIERQKITFFESEQYLSADQSADGKTYLNQQPDARYYSGPTLDFNFDNSLSSEMLVGRTNSRSYPSFMSNASNLDEFFDFNAISTNEHTEVSKSEPTLPFEFGTWSSSKSTAFAPNLLAEKVPPVFFDAAENNDPQNYSYEELAPIVLMSQCNQPIRVLGQPQVDLTQLPATQPVRASISVTRQQALTSGSTHRKQMRKRELCIPKHLTNCFEVGPAPKKHCKLPALRDVPSCLRCVFSKLKVGTPFGVAKVRAYLTHRCSARKMIRVSNVQTHLTAGSLFSDVSLSVGA